MPDASRLCRTPSTTIRAAQPSGNAQQRGPRGAPGQRCRLPRLRRVARRQRAGSGRAERKTWDALVPACRLLPRLHGAPRVARRPDHGLGRLRRNPHERKSGMTEHRDHSDSRRRVDILAYEHAHGRLTPSAVAVGRDLEAALEAASRSAGSAWCEKVDGSSDGEAGALAGLEAVHRARVALQRVERVVGTADAILLRDALAEGLSFDQMAERHGRTTRRGIASIASRFRADLETLARAQAARGKVPTTTADKYTDASDSLVHRKRVMEPV